MGEEEGGNLVHVSVTVDGAGHLQSLYEKNHTGRSMPSLLQVLLAGEENYLMEGLRRAGMRSKSKPPSVYPEKVRSLITPKEWVDIRSHVGR